MRRWTLPVDHWKLRRSLVPGASLALVIHAWCQTPLYSIAGDGPNAHLGYALSAAGDVNADGVPDLIIPLADELPGVGLARVYSGKDGSILHEIVSPPLESFGSIGSAGDVNLDGYADFLLGSPGAGTEDRGRAFLYSGKDAAVLYSWDGDVDSGHFGFRVAGGGDLDGDGIPDVLVAAIALAPVVPTAGAVRAFSGKAGSVLYTVYGTATEGFGASLAFLGDLDGDSRDDFGVGAPGAIVRGLQRGAVRVLSGSTGTVLYSVAGDSHKAGFGSSAASVGDVDGDLFEDFVVGAPLEGAFFQSGGQAKIVSGSAGKVLKVLYGGGFQDFFGSSVAGIGDHDGDGFADLIIAAPGARFPNSHGQVTVFATTTWDALLTLTGHAPGDRFGEGACGLGDLNGDGLGDFAAGTQFEDVNGVDSGAAYVYLSECLESFAYCSAKLNSAGCFPLIDWNGEASLSVGDGITTSVTRVVNNQLGLLAWSLAPASTPFFGGILCLEPPVVRTAAQTSGGGPPPAVDCSGGVTYQFSPGYLILNQVAASSRVYAQFWYRDPFHSDGTGVGLSDALSFPVCQ